ncbi:DivIVA domain-containing protein [Kytococcus sp. Marseille-QA3725]
MPLNPDDLFEREFEETRLRPGYDKAQVNEFLDGVQVELRRLISENESLRDRLYEHGGAPAFAGGWEGPVEPVTPSGTLVGGSPSEPEPADDGFVPAGAGIGGADAVDQVRQESDQRIMAAMHAAESAEYDAHQRMEAVRREQAEAEAALERVKQRVAGLTAATDRVERAGEEGAEAGELLAAAQRLHDEHVWAAEETARSREAHVQSRLEGLEARIADARQRLLEAETMLRARAEEFGDWAAEQRRHLAEPGASGQARVASAPGPATGRITRPIAGASSLWS